MNTLKPDATMEETLAYLDECDKHDYYKGYCVADLHAIFDQIADPADWKAPIQCSCSGEAVMATVAAIQFYTATTPTINLDVTTMQYHMSAAGYRNGPAGDH